MSASPEATTGGAGAVHALGGKKAWRLDGDVHVTPSLLMAYFAGGLLIAEAFVGMAFLMHWVAYPAATSGPPEVTVPNGPSVTFTLKAFMTGYVGVGGSINGVKDPTLSVGWGDHVTIALIDGENLKHNVHVDGVAQTSAWVLQTGQGTNLSFQATEEGSFYYYCTFPGHRQMGMQGLLIVGVATNPIGPEANVTTPFISHDPTAIPPPIHRNSSATVSVYLHAEEATAEIEPGVSFTYWTYNGTVPGPFLRVRVGDTVLVHFYNDPTSSMNHSVDFHAVTGPGGGAAVTQSAPGHWSNFTFTALMVGLFVYHCGTPNIPTHIAMGMYGEILVEPLAGLDPVDHEFYLEQGELYTVWPVHTLGNQEFNGTGLVHFDPTYVVFNGRYDAFTGAHALHVGVNDTTRIFFGDAGPNLYSAFHMIGAMFDKTWLYGDITDPPMMNLQTVPVPPGSSAMMEFTSLFPGNYPLVDHQITNAIDKGAFATLNVTGWANTSIFHKGTPASAAPLPELVTATGVGTLPATRPSPQVAIPPV